MTPGRKSWRPHVVPLRDLAAHSLTPTSPFRNTPDGGDDPARDSDQEMSSSNNRTGRSTSVHSAVGHSSSRPSRVPHLLQPSDVDVNPEGPVSKQAAQLIHEFVHPHHHHHSQENLLEAQEELDEAGGDAPVIAKELEEMQSRAWWKRPSALWYALSLYVPRVYNPNHSILRRFLCAIPFVLAASTTTAAPKIQVITRLVCRTLRPEYSNRSGGGLTPFASDDEEGRLCNADPAVQAAAAEFVTCERLPRHPVRAPELNPLDPNSDHHRHWYSELLNYRILGFGKLIRRLVSLPPA